MMTTRSSPCAALLAALLAAGCVVDAPPEGVLGEEGVAVFQGPFDAVFSSRLMVGSRFALTAVARHSEDAGLVSAARFASSDPEVIEVLGAELATGEIRLSGPGEAFLELVDGDGALVDRIVMRAAVSARTEVLDLKLLGTAVDPRAPSRFGVILDRDTSFAVTATDQCGGELFQVGAVELVSTDENLEVETADDVEFVVTGRERLEAELVLQDRADTPTELARHAVEVYELSQLDDVDLAVSDQEGIDFEVWGRAFASGTELLGLDYEWQGSADVLLSNAEGASTIGRVQLDDAGNAPATALMSAEAGTVKGEIDLLGVAEIINQRQPPPEAITPATSGCICDPSARCDPYAVAALGVGLWALRLRRRD